MRPGNISGLYHYAVISFKMYVYVKMLIGQRVADDL